MAFLTQNKAKLCKNVIITLVFEKNGIFFAKNCQKSQKILIITSTPEMCCSTFWAHFSQTHLAALLLVCTYVHRCSPHPGFCVKLTHFEDSNPRMAKMTI
jgi:hypothetical protein